MRASFLRREAVDGAVVQAVTQGWKGVGVFIVMVGFDQSVMLYSCLLRV